MANYAKIRLLFTDNPPLGSVISFSSSIKGSLYKIFEETAVAQRISPKTYTLNGSIDETYEWVILSGEYVDALRVDYNGGGTDGEYVITGSSYSPGNCYIEIEATSYGTSFDVVEPSSFITYTITPEVLPDIGIIGSILLTPASNPSDRIDKCQFNVLLQESMPYFVTSPVNITGEGSSLSFDYFRYPEPKSQLTITKGNESLSYLGLTNDNPTIFDVNTLSNVETIDVIQAYNLPTTLIGASPYIIGYTYDDYTPTDRVWINYRVKFSSDYVGHTLYLRHIAKNSGGSSAVISYDSIPIVNTDYITISKFIDLSGSEYNKLSNLSFVVVGDTADIISVGSEVIIERNDLISYDTSANTETVDLPRSDIITIDSVDVATSTSGATATININRQVGDVAVTVQYSLNGTDYYNSNIFTGLLEGNYTAYVMDSLGAVITYPFSVASIPEPAEEKPDPFIDISHVNSIQYSDNDLAGNFFALFSKQKFTNIEYRYKGQNFTQNDQITTQVRTNYDNILIEVINCRTGEVVQNPIATEIIDNIGVLDKRDCVLKRGTEDGTTHIYFAGGNVYEPNTDTVIGTNELRNNLLSWMKSGIKVTISDQSPDTATEGTYDIQGRTYDISIPADCMVINAAWANTQDYQTAKCQSFYDAEVWNVHEFDVDFSTITEGYYYIKVTFSDDLPNYTTKIWNSEVIFVGDLDYIKLDYSTEDRTIGNIVPTGIIHSLRVPAQFYEYQPADDVSSFIDDFGNEITLKRVSKLIINFKTDFIPPWMARKLKAAFLHSLINDSITIDDVPFTPIGESSIEAKAGERNPFVTLTQAMQSIEGTINTEDNGIISGQVGDVIGTGITDVLGL